MMTNKTWLAATDVVPFSKAGAPPFIIFWYSMKLGQIKCDHFCRGLSALYNIRIQGLKMRAGRCKTTNFGSRVLDLPGRARIAKRSAHGQIVANRISFGAAQIDTAVPNAVEFLRSRSCLAITSMQIMNSGPAEIWR